MMDIVLSCFTLRHISRIRTEFQQAQQMFVIIKWDLYMTTIIGRWPTLQRKCFTCVTCKCRLVRVKTLTPWSWALPDNPPVRQLLKNFPTLYATRRFIIVFTRALHWYRSWATSIQCIPPHPISLRPILILFTHLRLGHFSDLFPSGFPTKILYALFSPIRATSNTSI
jgi:hypothetical protein